MTAPSDPERLVDGPEPEERVADEHVAAPIERDRGQAARLAHMQVRPVEDNAEGTIPGFEAEFASEDELLDQLAKAHAKRDFAREDRRIPADIGRNEGIRLDF